MSGSKPANRATLALLPTATRAAGDATRLALRLRAEATLTGRCACGATQEWFEVSDDGALRPTTNIVNEPGRVFYARFNHEPGCPCICPELDEALANGEFTDPAGDLLRSLINGAE